MSLEDKILNPMAPAELPGQRSEPLPKAGKKRRKSGGTSAAAAGKVKKGDLDDEVGGDATAVLTLGTSDEARRPQKKMLFESASDGATLAFAAAAIRRDTSRTAAVVPAPAVYAAPVAKAPEPPLPAPVVTAPAAEIQVAEKKEVAPSVAVEAKPAQLPPAAPALKREPSAATPTTAAKSPVFQVAALIAREAEPKVEAPVAQAELALTVGPAVDEDAEVSAEVARAGMAPVVDVKVAESFEESLTLAFDTTLADGLAERTTAAQAEIRSEPETSAAMPSSVPEPIASNTAEPEPAAIETTARTESQPASTPSLAPEPEASKSPEPLLVAAVAAPVDAAPKAEPKLESETPNRGLSRSEAIARAARMSARTTARPAPTAAETLAAARTAQQQLRSADLPKQPGDIYGYWTRVKNGRRFPSRADFDAEQVAENWPNSMLLTCGTSIGAGSHGNFSSVLRLGANRRSRPGDDLNFTSMITEWILTTGGEAARAGTPVQDTEVFPTPDGTHAYKIVALPLSENQTRVDHVLCHLSRS